MQSVQDIYKYIYLLAIISDKQMYYLIDTKRLKNIWHVSYSKFLKTFLEFQMYYVLIFNTHPSDTHLELPELEEKKI